jgi:hypothetical protein
MNIKNVNINWMVYNNYFMALVLGISFSSQTVFCIKKVEKEIDFEQFLKECNYSSHCIKYLRDKYQQDSEKISGLDAFLEEYYYNEYYNVVKKEISDEAKVILIDKMEAHLILDPYPIEIGQEEPCLRSTNDGSDRGCDGLRSKALGRVKKEIKSLIQKAS